MIAAHAFIGPLLTAVSLVTGLLAGPIGTDTDALLVRRTDADALLVRSTDARATAAAVRGLAARDRLHPLADRPVLLVPGWFDSARDLAAIRIHLLGAGWADDQVRTLTFEEPTGSNIDHAEEIAAAVDELLAASGADQVDVVAHSMGGLAVRWYLMTRDDAPVHRVVFLGSPHRGTLAAHLAWGGGRDEMMPDSPFLYRLNSIAPRPEDVDVVTVRTIVDTHIVPGESATLPDVPDYALCCPTHAGLLRSTDVFDIVRTFLERGEVAREPSNGIRPGSR